TIPTAQVRSVQYDDPALPAAASGTTSAPSSRSAAAPPPPAAINHEDHYHPPETAITTTTYDLPAGTEISVRTEETIDSGKAAEGQIFPAEVTRNVEDAAGAVV